MITDRLQIGIVLLWFGLLHIGVSAQYPNYKNLNSENGLPDNKVYSLFQDADGFIWIGSEAGLFRYNGVRFEPFKSVLQKAKAITGMKASASGTIYCYNFKGQIFKIGKDSLEEITGYNDYISTLTTDNKGFVWVTGKKGIHRLSEKTGQWELFVPEIFHSDTYEAQVDKEGGVWHITFNGPAYLKDGKFNSFAGFRRSTPLPGGGQICVYRNQVWLFSKTGGRVYLLKDSVFEPYQKGNITSLLKEKKITHIQPHENDIWITTFSGVVKFNIQNGFAECYYPETPFSYTLIDRDGRFWFSSLSEGVFYVPEIEFKSWGATKGIPGPDKVVRIADLHDRVYYITQTGHIGWIDKPTGESGTIPTQKEMDVEAFYADPYSGMVYFSGNGVLYQIQGEAIKSLKTDLPPIKTLERLENGFLAGTSWGTLRINAAYKPQEFITPEWTRSIAIMSEGGPYWLATNRGLFYYRHFPDKRSAPDSILFPETQIISLSANTAYPFSLYGITFNGIFFVVFPNLTIQILGKLPDSFIAKKVLYNHGKLYIATNRGIVVIHTEKRSYTLLDYAGGLLSDAVEDIFVDEKNIWIATRNGVQCIPTDYKTPKFENRIFLKKLKIGEDFIAPQGSIKVPYYKNLSLIPEASAFSSQGNFQFAVRVLPHHPNWQYFPSSISQIPIPLANGKFTVEMKLVDYWGHDSENTIILQGEVVPPFWQTFWFALLVFILLVIITYRFYGQRIKKLELKQKRELDRIKLENELKQHQQAALKAQMNPHFIFNVLNSIKSYIYENDKKNAALYLSRFSDLIRKVLVHSSEPEILLKEEIELLELYIQLEAMLLEEDFSYSIHCDENVDASFLKLPALLIQPLIENAFKHGLRHKKGLKKLEIFFSYNPDERLLQVEIKDNGIGREAAQKINHENRNASHVSFAGEAIRKRMELLNSEKSGSVNLLIDDLKDADGIGIGTHIILNIYTK
ncbi:MAG: histidine kinase [Flavobacteriales bacterium]|nr:histidine kinase [Flavobacteriales bacterium]